MAEPVVSPSSTVQQDSSTSLPTPQKSTSNAGWVLEQGNITGLRNPSSATAAYLPVRQECNVTICDGTGAVPIGGGAANDTHLMGILILKNAGPATATIAGFGKTTDNVTITAATFVLTGSTAADTYYDFKGAINSKAAATVTGSVDETVIVFWRAV